MITFLTLTYKREHLLEECMYSFLLQKTNTNNELLIINDNTDVEYVFNHPNVRIINTEKRFSSISDKLKYGFDNAKFDYVYRLDDDDLLNENAISNIENNIIENTGFDVYRSKNVHYFVNNKYEGLSSNVNNGNLYTKNYINRITFPNSSFGEDYDITFKFNAKIHHFDAITMIYRWGMETSHISGLGDNTNEYILSKADEILKNDKKGKISLIPNFKIDYYSLINNK
jgi:hypothetical protein